jgi:glycerol-3-phosphate acyltransferase PlsX
MDIIRLAIDVESGDFGPEVVIAGILDAKAGSLPPFIPYLCGNKDRIEQIIVNLGGNDRLKDCEIIHCSERISPDDKRSSAWKQRADSSIIRSITLQRDGVVDASISAGDTAILLGAALFILGRTDGALRPVLAAFLPTAKQKPVLMLDVGANLECRTEHLVSFADLGISYLSKFLGRSDVSAALLNVGTEPTKGTKTVIDANAILREKYSNYIGYVEGNGVLKGFADIVVCDGFVGNALLKSFETFYILAESVLAKDATLLKKVRDHISVIDPDSYGAVPFLGIQGTVLKAHGGSTSRAIANSIATALSAVQKEAVWPKNMRPKGN